MSGSRWGLHDFLHGREYRLRLLAPACGWLAYSFGWHFDGSAAAVGMVAGLCIYVYGRRKYLGEIGAAPVNTNFAPALVIICTLVAAGIATLFHTLACWARFGDGFA